MSVNPINHQEILAFCTLRNIRMSAADIDVILQLDQIARSPSTSKDKDK